MAPRTRNLKLALGAAALVALAASGGLAWRAAQTDCCTPVERAGANSNLGLMTSLPIYWPDASTLGDLASGARDIPWQRKALEAGHALVPIDTLSPIPALSPDQPDTDPLAGLDRLAIIQPRGLSPADNVALDEWVREGGRLLLVLDPMLTGEYDLPLGDPRRPTDTALIPPVVGRWGLEMQFDEAQEMSRPVTLAGSAADLQLAGALREIAGSNTACALEAASALATCTIGEGRVTVLADAAMFEGVTPTAQKASVIQALVTKAFE